MPASAFEYFIERRNARVVSLLEQNRDVAAAIQGLLEHLVDFADENGVPFSRISLVDPHVTRDNYLVSRITAK